MSGQSMTDITINANDPGWSPGKLELTLSSGGQYRIVVPGAGTGPASTANLTERWLEIRAVDDEGTACAGGTYRVWKDAQTQVAEGVFDTDGYVRIGGLFEDAYEVEIIPAGTMAPAAPPGSAPGVPPAPATSGTVAPIFAPTPATPATPSAPASSSPAPTAASAFWPSR